MMKPQLEEMDRIKGDAAASARRLKEETERVGETVPEPVRPQVREALAPGPVRYLGANETKAAYGMIPPEARLSSRRDTWPHVRRRVRPLYG